MTAIEPIAARLFSETQRAIKALDDSRADAVRQVRAERKRAELARIERLADVRRAREEAARIISQSLKDEDEIEAEWRAAQDRMDRALAELAPDAPAMLRAAE
jgi:hypothetical protein